MIKTFEVGPDPGEWLKRLPADVDWLMVEVVHSERVMEFPRLSDVCKIATEVVFVKPGGDIHLGRVRGVAPKNSASCCRSMRAAGHGPDRKD